MNTETKHTHGPWQKLFLNGHWHIARTDGRVEVAKVSAYKLRHISTANARLIVAAPELLATCQEILKVLDEWSEEYDPCLEQLNDIRALAKTTIAKATKRSINP